MLCACGCGKTVKAGRRWFRGHKPPELVEADRRAAAARRQAAYRQRHPERVKAAWKTWYDAAPERRSPRARQWRIENPEKARELDARNNAARPREKVMANVKAQKARRRGAPMDSEAKEYALVVLGDPCVYCGAPATTLDHVVPLKTRLDSSWMNLAGACGPCNAAKQATPLLLFLLR